MNEQSEEKKLVVQRVLDEHHQRHSTRQNLYTELERHVGLPIVACFTSFLYPVMMEDSDADMLEGVLQQCDLSDGFALLLSSPGGDGLAAERIINTCRSYSGNGEYQVIVPSKAKSAATMVCLGATKLLMSPTSELGSVDPQMIVTEGDEKHRFSVHNLIKSYEELFAKAVKEKGNLEPYIQQLANYDAREIEEMRSARSLSEDIAVKALKTGMLRKLSEQRIQQKVKLFLTPEKVKTHGRAIYAKDAVKCGLNVQLEDLRGPLWLTVYELYSRLDRFVSTDRVAKCIECRDYSFVAGFGGEG
jgi:ATP-dependent protease ClpP protease subunit